MKKPSLSRRQMVKTSLTSLGLYGLSGPSSLMSAWEPSSSGTPGRLVQEAPAVPHIVPTEDGPLYPPYPFPWSGSWLNDRTQKPDLSQMASGQLLYLFGQIFDHRGHPLEGATVEIWQTDSQGLYKHPRAQEQEKLDPHFQYFSRVTTDENGRYLFKTIMPRWYNFFGIDRAPHIHLKMRSLDHGVMTTEMYFEGDDDDELRKKDQVFQSRWQEARGRLIVPKESPTRYTDLGIDFEQQAVCCKYDLAFLF